MYRTTITENAKEALVKQHNNKFRERFYEDILETCANPKGSKTRLTRVPTLSTYYRNCGTKYCILFNLDIENEIVHILAIWHRSYLHQIRTGKLSPVQ